MTIAIFYSGQDISFMFVAGKKTVMIDISRHNVTELISYHKNDL